MSLPGKYCIGILEEDNPLKSYFRFKPILIAKDGRFAPSIRRTSIPRTAAFASCRTKTNPVCSSRVCGASGCSAVVNLFDHPNENDKIRANKNYRSDETERNAYIIYSDVVREPDPGMLYTVLKIDPETAGKRRNSRAAASKRAASPEWNAARARLALHCRCKRLPA